MTELGAEYLVAYPNLFTQYGQDMVKFVILLYYYYNVYEGWYGRW